MLTFSSIEERIISCFCCYLCLLSSFHFSLIRNAICTFEQYLYPAYVLWVSLNHVWIYLIHTWWIEHYGRLDIFVINPWLGICMCGSSLHVGFPCFLILNMTWTIVPAELVGTKWTGMYIMLLRNPRFWWLESGMNQWVTNLVTWKGSHFLAPNWKRWALYSVFCLNP